MQFLAGEKTGKEEALTTETLRRSRENRTETASFRSDDGRMGQRCCETGR
jgi:hypothetical protein